MGASAKLARRGVLALGLAALALAAPAQAHHSFNMFALDKTVTLTGTVTEFRWSMPHVWLYVMAPGKDGGQPEAWGFECHAPNLVARKGWKHDSFKPGDKVSIFMHPMKDGSRAGSVIYVTTADGVQMWNADSVSAP